MPARRTILVVDDAPLMRELGALFLGRAGRVLTAANGEEALAVTRLEGPELIVADVGMPGFDGAALCQAIKADPIYGTTKIVLLAVTDAERERAVRAGADDVLPKPLDRVILLDTARRLLSEAPRGLPRIPLAQPAQMRTQRAAWDGLARNLSRGGVFVESTRLVEPWSEVEFEMRLPETHDRLASVAQVIWTRDARPRHTPGMGLRFLALDRRTERALSEWVEERTPHHRLEANR
ncbi:MAG: response regulator [Myxococcota bacterium]|nr:response regulator [Myxococcota bacterium]